MSASVNVFLHLLFFLHLLQLSKQGHRCRHFEITVARSPCSSFFCFSFSPFTFLDPHSAFPFPSKPASSFTGALSVVYRLTRRDLSEGSSNAAYIYLGSGVLCIMEIALRSKTGAINASLLHDISSSSSSSVSFFLLFVEEYSSAKCNGL